jgi:hypothetical protein
MKDKYTPGQDCGCYAYSESECGCDADWTPTEVYELREQLKSERALADRLAGAIQNHLELDQNIDATLDELNNAWECLQSSITAWKEARSE